VTFNALNEEIVQVFPRKTFTISQKTLFTRRKISYQTFTQSFDVHDLKDDSPLQT
jgi:hypothetical protein